MPSFDVVPNDEAADMPASQTSPSSRHSQDERHQHSSNRSNNSSGNATRRNKRRNPFDVMESEPMPTPAANSQFSNHQQRQRRQHPSNGSTSSTSTSFTNFDAELVEDPVTHPSIDVQEDSTSIYVSMDLPGVLAKDMQVAVQNNLLCISGVRSHRPMHANRNAQVCKKQRFSRRFAINTDVIEISRATANLMNGVLILYAPKKHRATNTMRIPVSEIPQEQFLANCAPLSQLH
eukprot:CAMPEP_0198128682 /NCGR_PEP_ID=MMETSP1442-20131203/49915_1 /TAXON_ID= /ORGANISM="Craspedostauros australis, Strain CCMP3328" /LENGTH=233 /DNA_ID=CAMNT_0043788889 /DNA_START=633 /DNA_END=1334 /DNA_ORIENTATION=+